MSVDDWMPSVVDVESVVGGVVMMLDVETVHKMCRDGRVVKALDLKSNGVSPRRFEPCS